MASSSSMATMPNWLELPRDLTANILQRLGTVEILTSARNVCPLWWNICKNPRMWHTIDLSAVDINSDYDMNYVVKICCYAVDLSSGLLEEIDAGAFGTDYLLQYIADRASNLRRMKLVDYPWNPISDKGLIKAVEKLSVLEELEIRSYCNLTKDSLEVIGRWCPLLKSLKYDQWIFDEVGSNEVAFSIAKTMSELRRLKLSGVVLTNVGLLAILDGCSLLESLDTKGCSNHNGLSASLQKRSHHQIKDVQLPEKSLSIEDLASAIAEVI